MLIYNSILNYQQNYNGINVRFLLLPTLIIMFNSFYINI
jgi:hypothetical protein